MIRSCHVPLCFQLGVRGGKDIIRSKLFVDYDSGTILVSSVCTARSRTCFRFSRLICMSVLESEKRNVINSNETTGIYFKHSRRAVGGRYQLHSVVKINLFNNLQTTVFSKIQYACGSRVSRLFGFRVIIGHYGRWEKVIAPTNLFQYRCQ